MLPKIGRTRCSTRIDQKISEFEQLSYSRVSESKLHTLIMIGIVPLGWTVGREAVVRDRDRGVTAATRYLEVENLSGDMF